MIRSPAQAERGLSQCGRSPQTASDSEAALPGAVIYYAESQTDRTKGFVVSHKELVGQLEYLCFEQETLQGLVLWRAS
eukprot:1869423-Amphidinium_carterae.1